jgi:hypothetical protein
LYVTFVSSRQNNKSDHAIAFRLFGDPDGGRASMQYLAGEFFPVNAPVYLTAIWTGSIQPNQWPELVEKCKTKSLRQLAKEYGVSHETVRRTIKAASGR